MFKAGEPLMKWTPWSSMRIAECGWVRDFQWARTRSWIPGINRGSTQQWLLDNAWSLGPRGMGPSSDMYQSHNGGAFPFNPSLSHRTAEL